MNITFVSFRFDGGNHVKKNKMKIITVTGVVVTAVIAATVYISYENR